MTSPTPVKTTCAYCGVGCGIIATPQADGTVRIEGDKEHPANFGRLCSKGMALGETLDLSGRLLHPEISGKQASWDTALDLVARRFTETIRDHGPDSVAFYVSGQLLTEDYYVANKLMKGYIGTANIDTNSRLCMASSVAGHRRAYGSDTVPGTYEDLEKADVVVLVGSNMAWCHPVLFQRLLAAREAHGTVIVAVDPRRTATAQSADLHLPLAPDSDTPLFLGLLNALAGKGLADTAYLDAHVDGADAALTNARGFSIARVAEATGLTAPDIARFYDLFAGSQKVVTVYSQGVNQSVCGTDKVNAIVNCHLYTGRIGKPGMGPFSVTGQPNAMGGREVGGLANMLAAHMNIEDEAARARVQTFWASPRIAQKPGLKAVDLFRAVRDGRIKALWIMGTNPADSLPEADGVQEALRQCPFVVVSDVLKDTDTTRFAHVLLPATGWGEKDGTVTNSERRISRQRPFLPAPGEARADWDIMADVARRMGFSGFTYRNVAAVFAEHAALSGVDNNGTRDFDISRHATIGKAAYDTLEPFLWPAPAHAAPRERFFADGAFFTPNRRGKMLPVAAPDTGKAITGDTPFWLNTGRIRDQWHTMTRSAKSPRLMGQYGEPFCEIHPADAARLGIAPASLLRLENARGEVLLRALVTDRQPEGSVFVPMHWTDQFASQARINALVDPAVDPVSGQPGLKASTVRATAAAMAWYGFAASLTRPKTPKAEYWALSPAPTGYRLECAGNTVPMDWQAFAADLLSTGPDVEWIGFSDAATGAVRYAAFAGDTCVGAFFAAPEPVQLARGYISEAIGSLFPGASRLRLLAGRGGADRPDEGTIICACNNVGINRIAAEVRQGATTVEAVTNACGAGGGCGSCRTDIKRIIDTAELRQAG